MTEIVVPKIDMVGLDRFSYSGFENDKWYADVELDAAAFDPDEGELSAANVVWTTDRVDLQPAQLGDGQSIRGRLYSASCEGGAVHVVTVTVTDSEGATATDTRTIELGQVC